MAQVTVMVGGRTYRMACGDGEEEHLLALSRRVDEAVAELRTSVGEVGDQRLAIMAAIVLADRLGDVERRLAPLEEEVERLRRVEREVERRQGQWEAAVGRALVRAAERVDACAAALEEGPAVGKG